jgi:hypothetical protein
MNENTDYATDSQFDIKGTTIRSLQTTELFSQLKSKFVSEIRLSVIILVYLQDKVMFKK